MMLCTNAVAPALDTTCGRERMKMLRFPHDVLLRILRTIDKEFNWSPETAKRLQTGDCALHNVQVALYLNLKSRKGLERFLAFLAATYCTPIVMPGWRILQLGHYLGLSADVH